VLPTHSKCQPDPKVPQIFPSRLLDVQGADEKSTVCLVDTVQRTDPYIALSYCWGEKNQPTTILSILVKHQRGTALQDLPDSHQDVVFIARKLGVCYVWIDAYCIVQDDREEWSRESAKMGSIYRNAHLIIVAGSVEHLYQKLLGPRTKHLWQSYRQEAGDNTSLGLQVRDRVVIKSAGLSAS
jgi:hypothetical protein